MQQVTDLKELCDVYVPVQLYKRKTSALLDTSCDTSIIGAQLLPLGVHVEPTLHMLRATSGSTIPLEGIAKVTFHFGTQEFTVFAVVTKAVHELILGIDFLTDNCRWKFGAGQIQLHNEWVSVRQHETKHIRSVLIVLYHLGSRQRSRSKFLDQPGVWDPIFRLHTQVKLWKGGSCMDAF